MNNIHFIGEWFDCRAPEALLSDAHAIQARCIEHLARRHLPISYEHFTASHGHGVIGAMTGAGMHVVLRSFPQRRMVTADLYVEGREAVHMGTAIQAFDGLRDEFRPMRALFRRVQHDGHAWAARGRTPRAPTEVFVPQPLPRAM